MGKARAVNRFIIFGSLALAVGATICHACWRPEYATGHYEMLPVYNANASLDCTYEMAKRQFDQYMSEWEASGRLSSGCTEHWWLREMAELKFKGNELRTLIMDVGCNKGYFSMAALNYLAPSYGDQLQRFYQEHLSRGTYDKPCGGCGECNQGHPGNPAHGQEIVDVLCFEPSEVHVGSLARARNAVYGPPKQHRRGSRQHVAVGTLAQPGRTAAASTPSSTRVNFYIRHRAVSNHTGTTSFPVNCTVNTCSMGSSDSKPALTDDGKEAMQMVEVNLTTIDAEMAAMGDPFLDLVKIDTEGFDPVVLSGAYRSLSAHRIGVVSFEYHNLWSRSGGSLRQCVNYLEDLGYACFYDAPTVARISGGCWLDQYETRHFSNVVCTVRGSNMDDALIAGSYLRHYARK